MKTIAIKIKMANIKDKTVKNDKWLHQNKRYVALLNEYEKRVIQ